MKDLEKENSRLKRLVANLSLEKQVLKDISSGNLQAPNGAGRRLPGRGRNTDSRSAKPAGLSVSRVERNATRSQCGRMRRADTGHHGAGGPIWL